MRDKRGKLRPLILNRAQKEYARRCGKRNIVLKARQLGVTTYVAARFFIHTITHPGTLSVQVAHDQQSAEEIFRIVHRFVENLPAPLRKGALRTSRANVRQIVFPCTRQRISRRNRCGPERRPRADHPELALFGGGPLAAGCGRDAGIAARRGAAGWRDRSGVDARTAPAAASTTSGSGRTKPATRAISFPGGGSRRIAARSRSSNFTERS